jgi:hypothetical protein
MIIEIWSTGFRQVARTPGIYIVFNIPFATFDTALPPTTSIVSLVTPTISVKSLTPKMQRASLPSNLFPSYPPQTHPPHSPKSRRSASASQTHWSDTRSTPSPPHQQSLSRREEAGARKPDADQRGWQGRQELRVAEAASAGSWAHSARSTGTRGS